MLTKTTRRAPLSKTESTQKQIIRKQHEVMMETQLKVAEPTKLDKLATVDILDENNSEPKANQESEPETSVPALIAVARSGNRDELSKKRHIAATEPLLMALSKAVIQNRDALRTTGRDLLLAVFRLALLLEYVKKKNGFGRFVSWFDAQKFGISNVTRCKYMRFGRHLCKESKSELDSLLTVNAGKNESFVITFDDKRLLEIIAAVCDGQKLSEMYPKCIVSSKEAQPDQDASREIATPKKDHRYLARFLDQIDKFVVDVPRLLPTSPPDQKGQLLARLEELVKVLKGMPDDAVGLQAGN